MPDLSEYKIELSREPVMELWSYAITTPDGRTLHPVFGQSARREHAEAQALRRIELDMAHETLTGDELAARVRATSEA